MQLEVEPYSTSTFPFRFPIVRLPSYSSLVMEDYIYTLLEEIYINELQERSKLPASIFPQLPCPVTMDSFFLRVLTLLCEICSTFASSAWFHLPRLTITSITSRPNSTMIGAKVMDRTMKRKEEATDTIKVLKKTRVRLLSGIKIMGYPSQYPNIGTISKKL